MRWRVVGLLATLLILAGCAGEDAGAVGSPTSEADAGDAAGGEGVGGAGAGGEGAGGEGVGGEGAGGGAAGGGEGAGADGTPEPWAGGPATDGLVTDGLVIVSTVAPVADVVARVLGDRGRVETLIPAGADSHTYEPRPQDVAVLEEADGFLGVGLGLNDASVRLAEANLPAGAPLVLLGEQALAEGDLVQDHDHDGGHSHDQDGAHSHDHDHDGGAGVNPHVWTSVRNVMQLVERAAEALAELDADGTATYRANAGDYLANLRALDAALADAVGSIPEGQRKLVAYHDAWTYFGRDYGMEVVAAVQPSDFSEPSAADVRAIIDQIRAEQVPAVFGSAEFPSDVLAAIAEETGAAYVGDLADDTLPGRPGDAEHSYVGMMARSATAVVDALGGQAAPLEPFLGG